MKKHFFSIIIIFVICSKGFAQPQQVTTTEASWATITRVSVQTGRKDINVTDVAFCKNDNDNVLLYEVETDAGLTVLISGNKACQPIIGIHSSSEGLLLNKRDSPRATSTVEIIN